MKKLFLLLVLIVFTFSVYSQESFVYEQEGLIPKYIVTEFSDVSQQELFDRSIYWINDTYKNPDEVIKSKISNEKIRFEGVSKDQLMRYILLSTYTIDVKYTVELSFKNGKYKFEVITLEYYNEGSQYTRAGWYPIELNGSSEYYNNRGELRKSFRDYVPRIAKLFNRLNKDLSIFISQYENINEDW